QSELELGVPRRQLPRRPLLHRLELTRGSLLQRSELAAEQARQEERSGSEGRKKDEQNGDHSPPGARKRTGAIGGSRKMPAPTNPQVHRNRPGEPKCAGPKGSSRKSTLFAHFRLRRAGALGVVDRGGERLVDGSRVVGTAADLLQLAVRRPDR